MNDVNDIENLRNLGPISADWLRAVNIESIAELRRLTAPVAYLRVKQQFGKVSLNLLWALAAGLEDRDWRELTDAEKAVLRAEVTETEVGER